MILKFGDISPAEMGDRRDLILEIIFGSDVLVGLGTINFISKTISYNFESRPEISTRKKREFSRGKNYGAQNFRKQNMARKKSPEFSNS